MRGIRDEGVQDKGSEEDEGVWTTKLRTVGLRTREVRGQRGGWVGGGGGVRGSSGCMEGRI